MKRQRRNKITEESVWSAEEKIFKKILSRIFSLIKRKYNLIKNEVSKKASKKIFIKKSTSNLTRETLISMIQISRLFIYLFFFNVADVLDSSFNWPSINGIAFLSAAISFVEILRHFNGVIGRQQRVTR